MSFAAGSVRIGIPAMKLVAILSDIRSIHNVGSIFRTADGAGVERIYLCGITPSPLDRLKNLRADFAKVALGAEKYVPWTVEKDVVAVIAALKEDGYEIFALEQSPQAVPYFETFAGDGGDVDKKIALVLGAEVDGIPGDLLALADRAIEIPMRGSLVRDESHPKRGGEGKESLNVSVAFGIAAFGLRYLEYNSGNKRGEQ